MYIEKTQQFTQLHPQRNNIFIGGARIVFLCIAGAVYPLSDRGLDSLYGPDSIRYHQQKGSMD